MTVTSAQAFVSIESAVRIWWSSWVRISWQAAWAFAKTSASVTKVHPSLGLVAGLIAPRLQLENPGRGIPAILVFVVVMVLVVCSILAIRPKADFSFGADPTALVAELENYSQVSMALGLAEALATARLMNLRALDGKRAWYTRALVALGACLVGIAWLVYIGAIR